MYKKPLPSQESTIHHSETSTSISQDPKLTLSQYQPIHLFPAKTTKMYGLNLLLTTALALGTATLTAADTLPPDQNKWAQLRLFGAPGCSAENMLEMGIYGYERNTCMNIAQYGSVEAVNLSSMFDECECKSNHLLLKCWAFWLGLWLWLCLWLDN